MQIAPKKAWMKRDNRAFSVEYIPLVLLALSGVIALGAGIAVEFIHVDAGGSGSDGTSTTSKGIGSVLPVDPETYSKMIKAACVGDPDYNN